MLRILLKKYLLETVPLLLACGCVLVFFPWVRIWTVSQFELSGFAPLIEQFKAFEKFSPVPLAQFLTYEGIIGLTFAEPVVLLCVLTYCIARGSDVVSGEVGRGTMEMLLAQPLSRFKLIAMHGIVSLAGLLLLCTAVWTGLYAGINTNSTLVKQSQASITLPGFNWSLTNPLVSPEDVITPLNTLVSSTLYIPSTINLFALGYFVFGLSVLMSSWDQYRWRTIGLVIGTYVANLLLFILAKSTPSTRFLMPYSFFAAYQPDWMVQAIGQEGMPMFAWYRLNENPKNWISGVELAPLAYSAILIFVGSIAYAVGTYIFCRRDLPAPT